ncbi:uncharacterized protein LOC123354195 isoform X5 [Mauremys mutica]|uniref:uncharacterized protein LOC123354195 isoform X5 n=1 Tax=Mauremys mutica TaxID=74926 RepID=UPI001D16839A|nr:uncharacterized protein LOC123354195 isoform X5 [Mauremys mutica]
MEPLDNRDPLFPPPNETADLPLPNLTPRHQELIPTPCGPIKPWSELSSPVKIYFCVTILSLLSVIGITTETLFQQTHEDFTISLIQLIGVVFCVYYVTRGILQENRQELIVFVLSILLVMFRSIVNFTVVSAQQKPNVLARFILILLVGSFDVICAIILIQSQSMMAFRVGGALESLQSQYFMLNLCFSMLTFDLQAQHHPSSWHLLGLPKSDRGHHRSDKSLGPGTFLRPGSCRHHWLLHLHRNKICSVLGTAPCLSQLWTGAERENVFFLWKD